MIRITLTILAVSSLTTLLGWNSTNADEVVLCISQEEQYAVLMEEKGQCTEDETEFITSGPNVERNEKALPMVISSNNEKCEDGSSGTTAQIGFDKNDDGELGKDEILTTTGWCTPIEGDESSSESES